MSENKKLLFLTGCVNPEGMEKTTLQDPHVRKQQYLEAIRFYLQHTSLKILFVDNSNTDLSSFFKKEIHESRIEVLSFKGNKFDKSLGKGYGECELIEYALLHSEFMRSADYVIKVTGRLCVTNVTQLISSMRKDTTVYAQRIKMGHNGMSCLSYFFGCPKDFLKDYFMPLRSLINDSAGVYFEHVLYRSVLDWKAAGCRYREFYLPIQLIGQSGSTGKEYTVSKLDYILAMIKYLYHKTVFYR